MKICIATSYAASVEPRAPRHAAAIARINPDYQVVFLDCIPKGDPRTLPQEFQGLKNLEYRSCFYQTRRSSFLGAAAQKTSQWMARLIYRICGISHSAAVSFLGPILEKELKSIKANIYIGYNLDTLLPLYRIANKTRSTLLFDCHEFYSDMGNQPEWYRKLIREIEAKCYPACSLIFACTDLMAAELTKLYKIKRILTIRNVSPLHSEIVTPKEPGFSLYWRNNVLNVGQRGLQEALYALMDLPSDITLHLQGRLPVDGGRKMIDLIEALKIQDRVILHAPYLPSEAVKEAGRHTVGLCLERTGPRNHDLTASNKIYDYMMAGLPVIASNLPGLRDVIETSGAGLLFKPGDVKDLQKQILKLYENPELLIQLSLQARRYCLESGANLEQEMQKLQKEFLSVINEDTHIPGSENSNPVLC